MHELVNHARLSGKTQRGCKALLSHNRVQYISSNIHEIRAKSLDRLKRLTLLVYIMKYIFIAKFFRVNFCILSRVRCAIRWRDDWFSCQSRPRIFSPFFLFPLRVARPLVTLRIHLALRNVPLAKRIVSSWKKPAAPGWNSGARRVQSHARGHNAGITNHGTSERSTHRDSHKCERVAHGDPVPIDSRVADAKSLLKIGSVTARGGRQCHLRRGYLRHGVYALRAPRWDELARTWG